MEKEHHNVVFIGHVNAGKSTTAGYLIYRCHGVSERTVEKLGMQTYETGKVPFSLRYAWILDKLKAERERGISIESTIWPCESERAHYSIIDAPGHRDYTKNMITGTSQADVAVLLVAVSPNREHFLEEAQTKEHALLAFTLGVKKLIVCVNKMDEVQYSEESFQLSKQKIARLLVKCGYPPKEVPFIPLSAADGDNITVGSSHMPWWKGPTLLETLDSMKTPPRPVDRPLRASLHDVYRIGGIGTVAVGRIVTGMMSPGTEVTFAPSNISRQVKSIEKHHQSVSQALPGDIIGFNVMNVSRKEIGCGEVVGETHNDPPHLIDQCRAHVIILDHPRSICEGYTPVIHCHTARIACRWISFHQKLDRRSGQIVEEQPKFLRTGDAALIDMMPLQPMCVEPYSKYPTFGRFAARDIHRTVAVGIIQSTTKHGKKGSFTKATQVSS